MNKAKQLILGLFLIAIILLGTPVLIENIGTRTGYELFNEGINQVVIICKKRDQVVNNKISPDLDVILARTFYFNGRTRLWSFQAYDIELQSDELLRSNYELFNYNKWPSRLAFVIIGVPLDNEVLVQFLENRQEGIRVFRLTWFGLEELHIQVRNLFGENIWGDGVKACIIFENGKNDIVRRVQNEYEKLGGKIIYQADVSMITSYTTRTRIFNEAELYLERTINPLPPGGRGANVSPEILRQIEERALKIDEVCIIYVDIDKHHDFFTYIKQYPSLNELKSYYISYEGFI